MKYREEFIFENDNYSVYFKIDCDDSNAKNQVLAVVRTFQNELLSNGAESFLVREYKFGKIEKQAGKHRGTAPTQYFKYKVAVNFTAEDMQGIVITCTGSHKTAMAIFNAFKNGHTRLFDENDELHSICVEYLEDGVSKMMVGENRQYEVQRKVSQIGDNGTHPRIYK